MRTTVRRGRNFEVRASARPFVITDGHPARARGLNVVGLRRAGVTASQLRVLHEAYRLLLRSGLPAVAALEKLEALGDPLASELAAFVRASKRGIAHAPHGSLDAAGD